MSGELATKGTVVALDGPSGVGKSSTARRVAEALDLPYLDTGAMYRALGLEVLESGVDPTDEAAVARLLREIDLDVRLEDGRFVAYLDGEPVEGRIRSPAVGDTTSKIAALPKVRRFLVDLQRRLGRRYGGVLEGRDIGTVVFPETPHKFFLDAPLQVRASRRRRQLSDAGTEVSAEEVRQELETRDRRDSERTDSPLKVDDSYTVIDTASASIDQVVAEIVRRVRDVAAIEAGG